MNVTLMPHIYSVLTANLHSSLCDASLKKKDTVATSETQSLSWSVRYTEVIFVWLS